MVSISSLKNKKILVFGIGISGQATIRKLQKKVKDLSVWDDNVVHRNELKKITNINLNSKYFKDSFDFIVMSPGIDIYQHSRSSFFIKNFGKIITDVDIFINSIDTNKNKIIAITGTNGKSTFCKLLYHVIKGKNKNTFLLGNYGKPVLSYNSKSIKNIYILELSSYQIEYSKFLKFHACAVLNISPDHLERHKTFSNYINIKLKIFDHLLPGGKGFVNKNFSYNNRIQPKKKVRKISNIKISNIQNKFLLKENFLPSVSIVFAILKFLKISNRLIIKRFNSFIPLPHRQELIKKIKNISFINDSKATNFDSANFSLKHYQNIYWIAGGLTKKNDKAKIDIVTKKKIVGTYLIGKNISLFKQSLNMKKKYLVCKTLVVAIHSAFKDAKKNNFQNSTILLSPAAASFDQFRNFEDRGNLFKQIVKKIKNV